MDYEWNRAELLPPVDCPLVICVDGATVAAKRISHLSDRGGEMDYQTSAGQVLRGRFAWSYP